MKTWKKLGCGLVMFGLLLVIGLLNTDTAFAIGKGFEIDKDANTATYTVTEANKVIKKGVHKYSFKIKNAPVVDLRHCGVNVK